MNYSFLYVPKRLNHAIQILKNVMAVSFIITFLLLIGSNWLSYSQQFVLNALILSTTIMAATYITMFSALIYENYQRRLNGRTAFLFPKKHKTWESKSYLLSQFVNLMGLLLGLFILFASSKAIGTPNNPWVTVKVEGPNLEYKTFDSKIVKKKVSYHIQLPAGYSDSNKNYPVLYWLHGTEGGTSGVRPLSQFFSKKWRQNSSNTFLIVFVNGLPRRLWTNANDGSAPVESVFIQEVIPHVDQNYRTIHTRQGRVLEGFSMGGFGAARLGLKYPELFSRVSILAGGPLDPEFSGPRAQSNSDLREEILASVCSGDLAYFKAISPWEIAKAAFPHLQKNQVKIRLAIGNRDITYDINERFHNHLKDLKIDHSFLAIPKVGHDPIKLLENLKDKDPDFY